MGLKEQVMTKMIEECVAPLKNLLDDVKSKIQSLEDFKSKIVAKITGDSTDEEIPTAKSVFDFVDNKTNITVVENPNLWQLEPGWYYVHTGFYYGTNQHKAITDGVLFIAGSEEWAYFVITKTAKYSGDLSSDGETVTGTCNVEVITTSISEASTDEEYPSAKAVFDALSNVKTNLVQSLSGTVELAELKQGVLYVLLPETTLNLLNGESFLVEVSGYIFINTLFYNDDEIEAVSFSYFGLPFDTSAAGVVMSEYEETTVSEYVSMDSLEHILKEYEEACTETFQLNENLTQTIDENSTDEQYPSAKAVYDFTQNAIQEALYVDEEATV